MSSCCSAPERAEKPPKKQRCPANGCECAEVSARTIAHHITESWAWQATGSRYYFCDDPDCEVAYFDEGGSVILKSQLRTRTLLCYCFGVSKADYQRNPAIREFVVAQTRSGLCSCETSNPSGRCCLKDFPKPTD